MQVQCKKTKSTLSVIPTSDKGKMSFQDVVTKVKYQWEDLEPVRSVQVQAGTSSGSVNAVTAKVLVAITGSMITSYPVSIRPKR